MTGLDTVRLEAKGTLRNLSVTLEGIWVNHLKPLYVQIKTEPINKYIIERKNHVSSSWRKNFINREGKKAKNQPHGV